LCLGLLPALPAGALGGLQGALGAQAAYADEAQGPLSFAAPAAENDGGAEVAWAGQNPKGEWVYFVEFPAYNTTLKTRLALPGGGAGSAVIDALDINGVTNPAVAKEVVSDSELALTVSGFVNNSALKNPTANNLGASSRENIAPDAFNYLDIPRAYRVRLSVDGVMTYIVAFPEGSLGVPRTVTHGIGYQYEDGTPTSLAELGLTSASSNTLKDGLQYNNYANNTSIRRHSFVSGPAYQANPVTGVLVNGQRFEVPAPGQSVSLRGAPGLEWGDIVQVKVNAAGRFTLVISGAIWARDEANITFLFAKKGSAHTATAEAGAGGTATAAYLEEAEGGSVWKLDAVPELDRALSLWESRPAGAGEEAWATDEAATAQGASALVTIGADTDYRAVFAASKPALTGDYLLSRQDKDPLITFRIYSASIPGRPPVSYMHPYSYSSLQAEELAVSAPVPGARASLIVPWVPTGPMKVNMNLSSAFGQQGIDAFGKYMDFELFQGDGTQPGDVVYSRKDIALCTPGSTDGGGFAVVEPLPSGAYVFKVSFVMPESDGLTFRLTYKDVDGSVISVEELAVAMSINRRVEELRELYDTPANISWRYLINRALNQAADAASRATTDAERDAVVAAGEAVVLGYLDGTNTDYITVSFAGNTVRVNDKASQEDAFCAALE
jgi:hypothetical protein